MKKAGRPPKDQWKRTLKASEDSGTLLSVRIRPALRRIGVTEGQLAQAPQITPLLKLADGGMATVISAMRFAPDAVIAQFLAKYDTLSPTDRKDLPIEAVALAAGVDIRSLLGAIMFALQAQSVSLIKVIATTAHPEIIRARIRYGKLPGGHQDRAALDTAMGFLPNPRGPLFIGKAIYNSGADAMQQQRRRDGDGPDEEDEDDIPIAASDIDLDKIFPPANLMQEKLIPIRNRILPPPKGPKTPVN
jgi:hypothetical protein